MIKSEEPMSGAIRRHPGETFASFAARQKEAQAEEALMNRRVSAGRVARREKRYADALISDHNLDPCDDYDRPQF